MEPIAHGRLEEGMQIDVEDANLPKLIEIFELQCGPENQRELCFEAVVTACRNRNWKKIEKAGDVLIGLCDRKGHNILFTILERLNKEIVEDIVVRQDLRHWLSSGNFNQVLHAIAKINRPELVPVLKNTVSIKQLDLDGRTCLHVAIQSSNDSMVHALVNCSEAIKTAFSSKNDLTLPPFLWAIVRGRYSALTF